MRWRSGLLPDLFGQVAHFVFHLAKDHSFADGNKRTAMSVSLALLDKEGINLAIDDDADPAENTLYKLISALVTEIITEETFASEFRNAGRVSGVCFAVLRFYLGYVIGYPPRSGRGRGVGRIALESYCRLRFYFDRIA